MRACQSHPIPSLHPSTVSMKATHQMTGPERSRPSARSHTRPIVPTSTCGGSVFRDLTWVVVVGWWSVMGYMWVSEQGGYGEGVHSCM